MKDGEGGHLSESTNDHKEDPTHADAEEMVWPPAIEYPLAGSPPPIVLTTAQLASVHYRWFHALVALMMAALGANEYFSTFRPLLFMPHDKLVELCFFLLVSFGNLWRAYQGWQWKAILDRQRPG